MILSFKIKEEVMLKDFLKKKIPNNVITSMKNKGQYLVNDQAVNNHYLLKKDDLLQVVLPIEKIPENISAKMGVLDILYEDSYLLIINKPAGIATIPTGKHFDNSLANLCMGYYIRKGIASSIHFISRLDYPTSGIVSLAKNAYIATIMKSAFRVKKYLLVVKGLIDSDGMIEGYIYKDSVSIKRYLVFCQTDNNSKEHYSKTIYRILGHNTNNETLIEATLLTGKTHQLRVHFSTIGYPIKGDILYGDEKQGSSLYLHSYYLEFVHPVTKENIEITNYPQWYDQKEWHL